MNKFTKYVGLDVHWLSFQSFTPSELERAIDEIGAGFGSQYQFTVC